MKKILLSSLLVVFAALTACAGKNSEGKNTSDNKEEKVTTTRHLTKAEFLAKVANYEANPTEWKYLGDKPCLIDFYASWCGPCKRIAPILEELAAEYAGEIYIYKIDTEAERELAAAFGVRSIPTLLFCPMGEDPTRTQGALPKETFQQLIEEVLLKRTAAE